MGIVDDHFHAQAVGQFERRNIARLGQSAAQGDHAFIAIIVVVRGVGARGGLKGDRRVENGVIGRGALIDGSGIDEGFER